MSESGASTFPHLRRRMAPIGSAAIRWAEGARAKLVGDSPPIVGKDYLDQWGKNYGKDSIHRLKLEAYNPKDPAHPIVYRAKIEKLEPMVTSHYVSYGVKGDLPEGQKTLGVSITLDLTAADGSTEKVFIQYLPRKDIAPIFNGIEQARENKDKVKIALSLSTLGQLAHERVLTSQRDRERQKLSSHG